MLDAILQMDCLALAEAIRTRQVSSLEATSACLEAIDKYNQKIGAFLTVFQQQALDQARDVDRRIQAGDKVGPLAGVPIAVKDNICTTFGPTTCGSKILANFRSPCNATVVERLMRADAIIIGKTNMDEFAMGSTTENSAFGPTHNPWDLGRVAGGSSGGSAAAVAARMCFGALGSDTGGSIRQPAAFCGVVGLKPTYGRVSRFGLVAYGSSLDQIGPLARSVRDCALLLNVIGGHDPKDSTSVPPEIVPDEDLLARLDQPIDGLRIGLVKGATEGADLPIRQAIGRAVDTYRAMGAEVVELEIPALDYSVATYYIIATAEASSNLARYDGVHYGYRSPAARDCMEVYTRSRAEGLGKEVKRRIMLGTYALSSGYYDAYYLKALKVRNLIRQQIFAALGQCDSILMPVAPTTAFSLGQMAADPLKMYLADVYTIPANLAGIPAISIPVGLDGAGLPVGVQLLGPAFSEGRLLRIARILEKGAHWTCQVPAGLTV
ncbi:MAG: Asp-tRNA(Asn)/Glu-tRNA(Gln) amidotransferase subunit GatA [Sedimentisphaerales bacterium]|nr:Asp-tRNA(Asn)/Glu-tRNA(Gln) amidotransferase subunit GatA [Sedimentisphaerales bacterium]